MRKWMALLFLGLLGLAGYVIRPKPLDDGWSDIEDKDWWG